MKTFDANGSKLTQTLFVKIYDEARKLAPARFLTLKMNSKLWEEMYAIAEPPEAVQLGATAGPFGKRIIRIVCIKLPQNVAQGVAMERDDKIEPSKMIFEI